jgi:hypothetical protein
MLLERTALAEPFVPGLQVGEIGPFNGEVIPTVRPYAGSDIADGENVAHNVFLT